MITGSYINFLKKYEADILSSNDKHYLATKQIIKDLDDLHSAFILDGYFDKSDNILKLFPQNRERVHKHLQLQNKSS